MKSSNKFSSKLILIPTLLVVAISFLILTISGFNYDNLSGLVTSYGVLGAVFYMALGVLSIVLAPTSTIPLWPVVLGAYGFWVAVILTWVSGIVGAIVNYYIAKIFGRPVVKKLIGEKALSEVDRIAGIVGWKGLVVVRTIGNASFDYASYAFGLAKYNFKSYLAVTAITTFFWDAAVFFFLGKAISLTLIPSIAVMIGMYFLAVFIGVKVWRYYLKVEKKSK
ncbi:hypothetical protein A3D84_02525 [Candidatus Woesebacteria bacterium RIFCSPHIGHO2_02_FULL_42_20]|uniref:TVP38/TMEM64 family membrane protein n=1 Tax=Candidatus Woesebacteria bacterium RIFCSPHIGHO2_12_FULL_41_24 TaxID=1802510 RepID=A0A1F8APK3_9BACT|nr:MAG: hypothetical protein A2W15_02720 [Candidatus Woesebacteria bacterium RBG_16_41_13]OGM29220.1 MAG: hypothetical protein A2873_03070 [Candidatus Woesebacteria bacterium RIFCSPHIGHO2_01_FULL_42_80]OGM34718.1 MAG: hypothetical protein A3D84_02525 [Candidatus Woesebacteria bacterium RIFCSPHIGHO2_02_FULL_42_20]OGM53693.1 MAG: hypothetical protein A3E44_02315 [Candidatus Woesebacteria bacterium RIFCSPHIGHO2_12_FULL_41_24]OGM67017.1 MAG: hypothetical protein A2969_05720 [Candidatus Woesebacteri